MILALVVLVYHLAVVVAWEAAKAWFRPPIGWLRRPGQSLAASQVQRCAKVAPHHRARDPPDPPSLD
ncbi:hypothetical protein [Phenylobacterium sp.]|uniref:hypothetical protein n=1 Tax=Phenylobacterium sp. TaxID=1871053 RepID=UPI004035AB29